jgi:hypothetical protein
VRRLLDYFRRPPDGRQLTLELAPAASSPPSLTARLAPLFAGQLGRLVLTRNRSTLMSCRRNPDGRLTVRLHECFASADDATLAAVAVLATTRPSAAVRNRARALVRAFAAQAAQAPEASPPRPRRPRSGLVALGQIHDLAALRDEINRDYFGGRLQVAIGWSATGAAGVARRRRSRGASLHLGTWNERDQRIRIHPVLDHPSVPREVVAAVVHHELLHAELGAVVVNGRRYVHTAEFRRREREFAHFELAEAWVAKNFKSLVARRAKGLEGHQRHQRP